MALIQTTAGAIEHDALGRTLAHEHLLTAHEGLRFQWPHLVDVASEIETAVAKVKEVAGHGVQTIVDPSCLDLCRDVRLNLRVQDETGVRFVMATGVYGQHYTFLPHYFQTRDISALVDCFVHDLEVGIQGTPVRAAFLKCACDEPGMTPDVEKVHRAVAQASVRTGAPIMVHSHPASRAGLASMVLFAEEGVDPAKVCVAHTGDTDDLGYIRELLATGATIGMDRYGLDFMTVPQAARNATIAALVDEGFADRMVLSQDHCATIDWFPAEVVAQLAPKWSFTLIFDEVIPELLALGVEPRVIDAMLEANVQRWLAS